MKDMVNTILLSHLYHFKPSTIIFLRSSHREKALTFGHIFILNSPPKLESCPGLPGVFALVSSSDHFSFAKMHTILHTFTIIIFHLGQEIFGKVSLDIIPFYHVI